MFGINMLNKWKNPQISSHIHELMNFMVGSFYQKSLNPPKKNPKKNPPKFFLPKQSYILNLRLVPY